MAGTCSADSPLFGSPMPVYINDLVQNTLLIYFLDIAMVDAFSQRYQTVSACVSLLTFSLNLVLWLTCFDLTISHYSFFSLLYCLKCCESLVKLSDVGEFCSPKLCLDDQQTGAEAQLPPLHKSSPNLFFDQLPSQQDQAACKQWKYWLFWQKKCFFTLASVLWMATLSYRHFLTISCWPLDSSCSNKLGKVEKVNTQFHWSICNSSISLNFGRPDSLTFCKLVSVSASERISCFIDSEDISTQDWRPLICDKSCICFASVESRVSLQGL